MMLLQAGNRPELGEEIRQQAGKLPAGTEGLGPLLPSVMRSEEDHETSSSDPAREAPAPSLAARRPRCLPDGGRPIPFRQADPDGRALSASSGTDGLGRIAAAVLSEKLRQ
jgi:hypothetical protein